MIQIAIPLQRTAGNQNAHMPTCRHAICDIFNTRWHSWYEMLDWSIKRVKPAIITVTSAESDLAKTLLSADEWRTLDHVRDFLQNFYVATKATEGHGATLKEVLCTMDFLADIFQDAVVEFADHAFMWESLQAGFTKLLKY